MAGLSNITLPTITDEALNDKQERRKILEALYQLTEQLRFVLSNLDEDNIAPMLQEKIETASREAKQAVAGYNQTVEGVGGLRSRVTQAENNITAAVENAAGLESRISVNEQGIAASVRADSVIAAINLSPEEITILANKINLCGAVSVNGTFTIDQEGYLVCTGGRLGDLVIAPNAVGIINNRPFCIGNVVIADESIGGVTTMPHLQLSHYNMGMPEPDPNDSMFVIMRPDGTFGLRGVELKNVSDEQGGYAYYLEYTETDTNSDSQGGGVTVSALRTLETATTWYTDASCTKVGGSLQPNQTYKRVSGNQTSGIMEYDSSSGFWRRTDRTTRYLPSGDYYVTTTRMLRADN